MTKIVEVSKGRERYVVVSSLSEYESRAIVPAVHWCKEIQEIRDDNTYPYLWHRVTFWKDTRYVIIYDVSKVWMDE